MQQNFIRWQPFTAYLQTLNQSKYFFLGTQEHSFGLLFPEYTTLEACVPRTCGLVALCITLCCTDEQYAPIDTNRNASRFFCIFEARTGPRELHDQARLSLDVHICVRSPTLSTAEGRSGPSRTMYQQSTHVQLLEIHRVQGSKASLNPDSCWVDTS